MKINPRLLQETRHTQTILILAICLGLGGGLMGILQARQVSRVINQVFVGHQTLDSISPLLLVILAYIFLRAGFTWVGEVCASSAAQHIKEDLRQRLFSHILGLGPAFLRGESGEINTRTGELVSTATEGIDALEVYLSQYLPQIVLAALIPLATLFFVFPIDTLSALIFLVTAPLLPLFMYLIGSAAEAHTRKQWQGLGRMSAYFLDVIQGLTTLKTLGRSREQIEVIRKVSEQYRQTTMGVLRFTFLSALVLELVATLSTAVVAVEIGLRLLYGKLAFEQAFFVLILAPEFYQPLRMLGTRFHAGMSGIEAARRIFEILDLPLRVHPQNNSSEAQAYPNQSSLPAISLKNVAYIYEDGRSALRGISFEIPPGKITALVGKSGAGKTTLTWLIMRFLNPQSGQILINDRPITEISDDLWWANLAWVPQNPYLFNDTILANIKLANPNAADAEVIQAAKLAYADEFIQKLPLGYQTQIGERGLRLSAGQAQRIALARAFLKDARLLILDEATSHLDPETDALIRSSLQKISCGRTVLVIAHHQNSLALADQVVRLSEGSVVEITQVHDKRTSSATFADSHSASSEPSIQLNETQIEEKSSERPEESQPKKPAIRRLLKLLAPYSGRILLSVILGFATIASSIGLMATAAFIISAAALHPSIADLQVAIVGVRFFGLARGIFRYLERLVSHDTTLRIIANWRAWFYQAIEPLTPGRLISYHSGDLLSRVISDINSLENFYVRAIAPPSVAVLIGSAILVFLSGLGVQLAIGLAIILVVAGIGLPLFALSSSRKLGPQLATEKARLSTLLVDGIQGSADLLTCGQVNTYIARVKQLGQKLSRVQFRMASLAALQSSISTLLANLGMMVVLIIAIPMVTHGQLNGVLLGMVALVAFTCFEALHPLPQAALNYDANRSAARRLYELVDASPLVTDSPNPLAKPLNTDLALQGVCFRYPAWGGEETTAHPIFTLSDISLSLPQGKHVALLGSSGAGKTTLVNLLLRFWDYTQGSIKLGGNELRDYRPEEIRQDLAVISQSTYLFSATIRENLLIARPSASQAEVIRATQQAKLHDFIESLPDGYDTWIGEHGLRLSAGERQRLAVARAFLKDAPLLILDEPTANLDPSTELALLNSMGRLSLGRSMLTISQSMAGLESMNEILVLQAGHIVERGTHQYLLSIHGQYQQMWELYHKLL